MNTYFRVRLGILVGAILLTSSLLVVGLRHSFRRVRDLESKLTSTQLESFRLADGFQSRLLSLNNAMLRYAARREDTSWSDFKRASEDLDRWIDQYDPRMGNLAKLTTVRERELFEKLNDRYDHYIAASHQVHTNRQPPIFSIQGFEQLSEFEREAEVLVQLGLELANAHRAAEESFLEGANQSLSILGTFLAGGVLLILGLVGVLGGMVYHDQIAPLRTKLFQNAALLEKQEKLATLGTLAAGIAHEIRNPLTSVKARLYTLEKHFDSPTLAKRDTEVISGEILRLERIVQDVLNFARPSEPEVTSVPALATLHEIRNLMASTLEKDLVQLQVEPGPELFFAGDSGQIKQVLINLIRNAAEAIDEAGTITLRAVAGRVPIPGRAGETVILEVSDTGRGIPQEVQLRLFDPFFTTKEAGTGLGLSIASRIVEKHGGLLQYQSRMGHGTTFGIVLPKATPPSLDPALVLAPNTA